MQTRPLLVAVVTGGGGGGGGGVGGGSGSGGGGGGRCGALPPLPLPLPLPLPAGLLAARFGALALLYPAQRGSAARSSLDPAGGAGAAPNRPTPAR